MITWMLDIYIYIHTYLNYSIHHDFRSWTFEVVKSNFGIFGVGKQRSLAYPSVSGGLFLGAVTENGLSWDMSQRGDPQKITRKLFCWWNICHVRLFVEFSTPQKILDKIHRDQKNAEKSPQMVIVRQSPQNVLDSRLGILVSIVLWPKDLMDVCDPLRCKQPYKVWLVPSSPRQMCKFSMSTSAENCNPHWDFLHRVSMPRTITRFWAVLPMSPATL